MVAIFYYTTDPTEVEHWDYQWVCGYVIDPKTDINATFPGIATEQIVDLFSTRKDDMHFLSRKSHPQVKNLEDSTFWNYATDTFIAPTISDGTNRAMRRLWNRVSNISIFTTFENTYWTPELMAGEGYEDCGAEFYLFRTNYGPRNGLIPLYRWSHMV